MIWTYHNQKGGVAVKPIKRSLLAQHSIIVGLFIVSCVAIVGSAQGGDYSFGDSVSKNVACIACHGNQAQVGSQNYINPTSFGHTTHAKFGCTTCHDTITSKHPNGKPVARTTSCGDCHGDIITQYSASIHGAKAACSGCQN